MHPNPAFRTAERAQNLAFARARGFGVLSVNGAEGPVMAHVPFLLDAEGAVADLHLARSNAVWQAGLPAPAVLAVIGPDTYVSPDWYGMADQVPTWNYVAVHLRGTLQVQPVEGLEAHATDLSANFEARLAGKRPWTPDKMAEGVMARMMRMIVPVRLVITGVEGTWKLGQNKPASARAGVIAALEAAEPGNAIATLMRALPDA
jgi:transcriptional regulator